MIDFPWDRSTWITLRDGVRRDPATGRRMNSNDMKRSPIDRLATQLEKRPQNDTRCSCNDVSPRIPSAELTDEDYSWADEWISRQ